MAKKTPRRAAAVRKPSTSKSASRPPKGFGDEHGAFPVVHLARWIKAHADQFQPPVGNKQIFPQSQSAIMFVSGGPNTRNDYHVNPTEELFYQIKGDIAVRVRPLDDSKPHDVIVKEGELFLLPSWVPHRPQRPAGTLGLIIEFPRGVDEQGNPQKDGLRWYCPECDHLVYEARWVLKKIDEDLKVIMHDFWDGPADRRTCKDCGHVIQRAGTIKLAGGRVTAAQKRAPRRAQSARR